MNIRVIFLGDVVGPSGCGIVKRQLSGLKKSYGAGAVIANGENSAQGNGLTPSSMKELFNGGVDLITTGNHAFRRKEAIESYKNESCLVRPANYPQGTPGRGWSELDLGGARLAVVNLMGVVYLEALDNPFTVIDGVLEAIDTPLILVDFHAEATAEKKCMGHYLAGRVSAVLGTHTHVQTNDAAILKGHTAYITDVGMTGPEDSVLGVDSDTALTRMRTHFPTRFFEAATEPFMCGVVVEMDSISGKATALEPFIYREKS